MSSISFKPENALKRADELILVGQSSLAFQNLHDLIMSKRLKYNQVNYENIMLRYIALAVNMKKGRNAKEALTQYRNQTLFSNTNSFEQVMLKFVEYAESKVPSDLHMASEVEDLDSSDAPESIIERILNGEDDCESGFVNAPDSEDSSTTAIRFLWEAYRISLDIVRNNAKLETFYRLVATKAFEFCGKYGRKSEFRRLCDVLRNHLSQIIKTTPSNMPHTGISLLNQESLTLQMHIRFTQLNTSIHLEVWPEAFKSIEDIYELLCINPKGAVDPQLMINYYEALTKIFRVSGNSLFLAAAWNKYLSFVGSQQETLPQAKLQELTTCTLLSALSVPIHTLSSSPFRDLLNESVVDYQESQLSRDSKITAIMGLSKIPTRDQLISEASSLHYWNHVDADVKMLYEILSMSLATESPFAISEKLLATLSRLNAKQLYAQFMHLVQKTVFSLIFEKIVTTLSEIFFDDLLTISSNIFLSKISLFDLEIAVLQEAQYYSQSFKVLVDDMTRTFYIRRVIDISGLLTPIFEPIKVDASAVVSSSLVDESGQDLSNLNSIEAQISLLFPLRSTFFTPESISKLSERIREICLALQHEQYLIHLNKEIIIQNRQASEAISKAKELKETAELAEKVALEQELLRVQRAELLEAQEQEKKKQELLEIQLLEKKKLIDQVVQKISVYGKVIDPTSFLSMSRENILRMQAELLAEGRNEVEKKVSAIAKRMDHLERALRQEERPILLKNYEAQRAVDMENHAALNEKKRALGLTKHVLQMATIKSAMSHLEDATSYFEAFKSSRMAAISHIAEKMAKELAQAKEKRVATATEALLQKKTAEDAISKSGPRRQKLLLVCKDKRKFKEHERLKLKPSLKTKKHHPSIGRQSHLPRVTKKNIIIKSIAMLPPCD